MGSDAADDELPRVKEPLKLIKDRFTAQCWWTGPKDPRAIKHAKRHGLNYDKLELEGVFDPQEVLKVNLAWIAELPFYQWRTATRGQKLRSCAWSKTHYVYDIDRRTCELKLYLISFQAGGLSKGTEKWKEMKETENDLEIHKVMLRWIVEMEDEVWIETEEGWNWRLGIEEQLDIRGEMLGVSKQLSWEE